APARRFPRKSTRPLPGPLRRWFCEALSTTEAGGNIHDPGSPGKPSFALPRVGSEAALAQADQDAADVVDRPAPLPDLAGGAVQADLLDEAVPGDLEERAELDRVVEVVLDEAAERAHVPLRLPAPPRLHRLP